MRIVKFIKWLTTIGVGVLIFAIGVSLFQYMFAFVTGVNIAAANISSLWDAVGVAIAGLLAKILLDMLSPCRDKPVRPQQLYGVVSVPMLVGSIFVALGLLAAGVYQKEIQVLVWLYRAGLVAVGMVCFGAQVWFSIWYRHDDFVPSDDSKDDAHAEGEN